MASPCESFLAGADSAMCNILSRCDSAPVTLIKAQNAGKFPGECVPSAFYSYTFQHTHPSTHTHTHVHAGSLRSSQCALATSGMPHGNGESVKLMPTTSSKAKGNTIADMPPLTASGRGSEEQLPKHLMTALTSHLLRKKTQHTAIEIERGRERGRSQLLAQIQLELFALGKSFRLEFVKQS